MVTSDKKPPTLVLGSTSPYRRELLSRLRIPFICRSPRVDEKPQPGEAPAALATRLALAKARDVAQQLTDEAHAPFWVIGSDQVADLDGHPIGKPGDHERALEQLRRMRGRTVLFHTAVAVCHPTSGFERVETSVVRVSMRPDLSDAELDLYLRLEEPYDCAGSAKVESLGITLLDRVESDDPTALIGLPLILTTRLLRAAGFPLFDAIAS
ncbi:MAG TPA: Maf family nucleotide pyrophosphatase [Aquabacterium sp.]|nr:Maf family nucleotide pyrophosphatase [Aquabacterium sp.]